MHSLSFNLGEVGAMLSHLTDEEIKTQGAKLLVKITQRGNSQVLNHRRKSHCLDLIGNFLPILEHSRVGSAAHSVTGVCSLPSFLIQASLWTFLSSVWPRVAGPALTPHVLCVSVHVLISQGSVLLPAQS